MTRPLMDLLEAPFAGNYFSDSALLKDLTAHASDRNRTVIDRAKALRRIGVIMGVTDDDDKMTDAEIVKSFDDYLDTVSV